MFHLLMLPFHLIGAVLSAVFAIIMLPVHLLLGLLHFAVGVLAFGLQLGIWVACIVLSVGIGTRRGLNPLLCLVLGMLGPVGLLIVVALAMLRPARAY